MIEEPAAKATYLRKSNRWKIYWQRADLNWHTYQPHPEAVFFDEFLAIVDDDEHGCFWGRWNFHSGLSSRLIEYPLRSASQSSRIQSYALGHIAEADHSLHGRNLSITPHRAYQNLASLLSLKKCVKINSWCLIVKFM